MSYIAVGSPIVRTKMKFYAEFGVLLALTRMLILSVHSSMMCFLCQLVIVYAFLPVTRSLHCLCKYSIPEFMDRKMWTT
jgi:hypothetical protein